MKMNSVYYKEHNGGIGSNPMGSLSTGSGPWWSGLVTQSTFDESVSRVKPSSMENRIPCGGQPTPIAPKPSDRGANQVFEKGNITKFNIFPGGRKSSSNGQKPVQIQAAFSMPEQQGHVDLGFGQPAVIRGKYPYGDQYYGIFSTYGPQITGRIMLPLNLSTDDGPIFVNAKQYHGIIRRRRSRAKAEMTNKVLKSRKPYLHHSRHLHAIRRPRGCGGRFLNTKTMDKSKGSKKCSPSTIVLQSDHSNLSSPDDTNGCRLHVSGSEVTSMFSMGDLNHFPIENLSVISLPEMMMSGNMGHDFGMHGKWVAAGGGDGGSRCNLTV